MYCKIPENIDRILFEELGAKYQLGDNFDLNLQNDDLRNKNYLGNYFFRSYSESYQLFTAFFKNRSIQNSFENKSAINILDIGTGTGGNVVGMLLAMYENGYHHKSINIYSLDGNGNALGYCRKIIEQINILYKTEFQLHEELITFTPEHFEQEILKYLRNKAIMFDVISTSKFVGEFYNSPNYNGSAYFKILTTTISNYLDSEGIYYLLDIVARPRIKTTNFKTCIMSDELNSYVQSTSSTLRYIYPFSCAHWYRNCKTKSCFISKCFTVSHSKFENDESKVAYRIMTHTDFAKKVISDQSDQEEFEISKNTRCKNGVLIWNTTN